jgi:uncharacterized membrane protein YdcZ (DUF606 family)
MNAFWFIVGGALCMFLLIFALLPVILLGLFYLLIALLAGGFIYGFIAGLIGYFKKKMDENGIKPAGIPIENPDEFTKILFDNGYKA